MTRKFNKGKPYGGSGLVQNGGLRGSTDTDYFYFFCPKCDENSILRILDYDLQETEEEHPYNQDYKKKYISSFTIAFELYCEKCNLKDFVKVSNMGL